jgi:prepilin-type N-terminal cleavage/methylation domain-containing protein/prepilin-type processing-associated H-X9-DG protein
MRYRKDMTHGLRRGAQGRGLATPFMTGPGGFSLLELLLVVAIILILSTLYWSSSAPSRQKAARTACQKNLLKLYISMEIFANEHAGNFPSLPGARRSEEVLDLLVPRYNSDTSIFICPGSRDTILPAGESFLRRKVSYAYYMGRGLTNSQQVLLTDKQVDTKPKAAGQSLFSSDGKPPGNNHGKFGGNLLFCDGHAEMSPAAARIPLPVTAGEALLNP